MDTFPSNSQRKLKAEVESGGVQREKVERIVTSEVTQRKKPLSKRFMETFFGGDARGTLFHVVDDILVPAAKDMVADAFTQGFERMIFGESRSGNRRSGSRSGPSGYVSYNRMGPNRRPDREREDPRISRRARTNHEFDEIILATRAEGEEVLDRLGDLIEQYEVATVGDLYDLLGITSQYTDAKWGWDDIRDARVERVRSGGYLLDLPRTKPVD
jgi:hypothetical protein